MWRIVVSCLCLTAAAESSAAGPASSSPLGSFVTEYCADCHDRDTRKGELDLASIMGDGVTQHSEVWEHVVRKLRTRQMPPPDKKNRPDERAYERVLASLEGTLDRQAAEHPNPGRTETLRRLNRTEYQNAIRDLLALDIDTTTLLPKDDASHGFDNVNVGGLSPTLLDRYITTAQKISRLAIGDVQRIGGDTFRPAPDHSQESHVEGMPLGTRGGVLVPYTFPQDAEYEIVIRLTRDRNDEVEGLREKHEVQVLIDRELKASFTVEPPRDRNFDKVDQHLHARIPVKAGPHDVGVTFVKNPSELLETKRQPYNVHFNMHRHPRIGPAVYQVSINGPYDPEGPGDTPSRRKVFAASSGNARPDFDKVSSPSFGPSPSGRGGRSSRSLEKSGTADSPEAGEQFSLPPREGAGVRGNGALSRRAEEKPAKQIFLSLARRAYRRPVTDADIEKPLALYRDARKEKDFDAGIEAGLSAILVSPNFLFRIERDPNDVTAGVSPAAEGARPAARANREISSGVSASEESSAGRDATAQRQARTPAATAYRISDIELASRLSFFLWSSIPDDELLSAAEHGQLHKSAVLEKQTRRMLADPRARSLASNFASQWLYLRNLDSFTPDLRLFPDFDDNLRQALREETELFFENVMREDRSALELLSANYTFLNERLAKHYGVPNVYGSQFRRVSTAEYGRGGLLRQGSILAVTSYATRTSPVLRGKFILENLIGTPPPPPPGNAGTLKDNTISASLSVRERLAAHRANPQCAGCHKMIDPPGFALENFDAVGRWRNIEEGKPVDASGGLPDGSEFAGIDGLEKGLLNRPDVFATTLTEKLLTFALGRGVEYYDASAVRKIVREAKANDYKFSSIIVGITKSVPFTMRGSAAGAKIARTASAK